MRQISCVSLDCVLVSRIDPRGIRLLSNLAMAVKSSLVIASFSSPPKTCSRACYTDGENSDMFVMHTDAFWGFIFWLFLNKGGWDFFSRERKVLRRPWDSQSIGPERAVPTHSWLPHLGPPGWLRHSALEHDFTSRSWSCSSCLWRAAPEIFGS